MSGALSGHLIDSYLASQMASGPFGGSSQPQNLAISGPVSFHPQMHGSPMYPSQASSSAHDPNPAIFDISQETAKKIASLQVKLHQKLGPEYLSQRPGPGGGPKLTYVEGWKVINLANEVFGFNGWSSSIINLTTDFVDHNEQTGRYSIGVTAIVRVTLRDGVYHEDVGYGMLENSKSKGQALDKCKKEAVTDALKRSLRNFGNLLGNCLYDKQYTNEVMKIKVQPPKFDHAELHRRPEFQAKQSTPSTASTSTAPPVKPEPPSNQTAPPQRAQPQHPPQPPPAMKPASSIPPHVRPSGGGGTSARAPAPATGIGPTAPITTPATVRTEPYKVAFTGTTSASAGPPAVGDSEDSFMLGSDDDAYFASVDLVDLGRPIEPEGDSEVHDVSSVSNASMGPPPPQPQQQRQAQVRQPQSSVAPMQRANSGLSRQEQLAAMIEQERKEDEARQQKENRPQPLQRSEPQAQPQRSVFQPLGNMQQQYQQRTPNGVNPQAKQFSMNPGPQPPQQIRIPVNRAATPSAGGFHFPPGMNADSVTGVKRGAEAMSGSAVRRPAPGMGLTAGSVTHRQPLGSLDIGENGDVKRMKR